MKPGVRLPLHSFLNISIACSLLLLSACKKEQTDEKNDTIVSDSVIIESIATEGGGYPELLNTFHRDVNGILDSITYGSTAHAMEYTGSNITTIRKRNDNSEIVLTYTSDGLLQTTSNGEDSFQKFVRYYDQQGLLTKHEYLRNQLQPDGSHGYEVHNALDEINIDHTGGTLKYKHYYESELIATYLGEVNCLNRTNNLRNNIPYVVLPIFSDLFFGFTNSYHYLISSIRFTNMEDGSHFLSIFIDYTFDDEGRIATIDRSTHNGFVNKLTFEYID